MIEVFDVMTILGTGNPRAMASGVSKATIPTMAGMVVALSGLFFRHFFERKRVDLIESLTAVLRLKAKRI
jgi:biopolymer transport protein ExbB